MSQSDNGFTFAKVDGDNNVVQVGTVHFPDGTPDGAWDELKATIEAEGCTAVLLDPDADLPAAGSTYDGKKFTAPEPVDPGPTMDDKLDQILDKLGP